MARYTLTVRRRGAVDRERFDSLDAALVALEDRLDGLSRPSRRGGERGVFPRLAPGAAGAGARGVGLAGGRGGGGRGGGRGEPAGRGGLRGGVDVRGDGSAEAYTGR